jgi:hypothetical protein
MKGIWLTLVDVSSYLPIPVMAVLAAVGMVREGLHHNRLIRKLHPSTDIVLPSIRLNPFQRDYTDTIPNID